MPIQFLTQVNSASVSACVVAPIGLFFGRCANFINGELYGRPTTVAWAVQFPKALLDPENRAQADLVVELAHKVKPGAASLDSVEAVISAAQTDPALADEPDNPVAQIFALKKHADDQHQHQCGHAQRPEQRRDDELHQFDRMGFGRLDHLHRRCG